ncbi:MAG: 30S ribosomal protein S20 [Deltaproteobacteria bacterium]|nr:MAG: 30S ribosomal protein S20 [Deltaproteobacteria bacterium]
MANHKSAKKRAIQNEKRRMRNRSVKTRLKSVIKWVRTGEFENTDAANAALNTAKSLIDKAAKKGVIHERTAARKISRLEKLLNASAT